MGAGTTTDRPRRRAARFDARRGARWVLIGLAGLTAGTVLRSYQPAPEPVAPLALQPTVLPSGRSIVLVRVGADGRAAGLAPVARTRRS
jgi:hypothetical protein